MHAKQALDERHDHVHVIGDQNAARHAQQRADDADQRALHQEDAGDFPRAGAQRAQDGDVGLLVLHGHDQRRQQVERRHRHDQRQDQEHHALLGLHRREPRAVVAGPVARHHVGRQHLLQLGRHLGRLLHVGDAQAHAGGAAVAEHAGGVLVVDEGQRGIVFIVAGRENAHHGELAHARGEAGRADRALRRHHQQRIAQLHAHAVGQLVAQHHAEAARLQVGELARDHLPGQVRHIAFGLRIDSAHLHAPQSLPAHQHALRRHERRAGLDFRVLLGRRGKLLPFFQHAFRHGPWDIELNVRQHRQHAVAHFFLETIHDRQHDDQGGDAQRDARHGTGGDERDEAIAAAASLADSGQPGIAGAYP
ncbi:hypothetical protein D9M68_655850 [compost metagenome]